MFPEVRAVAFMQNIFITEATSLKQHMNERHLL